MSVLISLVVRFVFSGIVALVILVVAGTLFEWLAKTKFDKFAERAKDGVFFKILWGFGTIVVFVMSFFTKLNI